MLNGDKKRFFLYLGLTVIYGIAFVEEIRPLISSINDQFPPWAQKFLFGLGLLPIWLLGGSAMWYGKKIGNKSGED